MLVIMAAPVSQKVFKAMQTIDTTALSECSDSELRPVLPGLVRLALCAPLDDSENGKKVQKHVLTILSRLEVVNSIVDMLSIDFHALEQDVKKEQQLRSKLGSNLTESVLVSQLTRGIALGFEKSESDPAQRIRLLLSELLFVSSELKDQRAGNYQKQSDLFECPVYLDEILDALCIAMAELPNLLNIMDISETLLCVENGPRLICQLVANNPESFLEVCNSLVSRGEKQEEESIGGHRRMELLLMLCRMNPTAALTVRNFCVEHCTMPGFAVAVTIQLSQPLATDGHQTGSDIVPFITSLLLGSDVGVRNWISGFVKAGQKRRTDAGPCMLMSLREHLLKEVVRLTPGLDQVMEESNTVIASAIVRLYCALKGIAAMKYSDEEMLSLLRLVTSHPPQCQAGAHFISLGICTLIASPGLLRGLEEEQLVVNWLRWLMSSETHFDRYSDRTDSPGEMLFLLALNFHNRQMQAIMDLVCNTLGMKISVKTGTSVKFHQIFTMELFTEQVVAAHAVKIPVTPNLDARASGYLPVHSILQLLKSRVFSKHKVSVKKWVIRQISSSVFPLHPLLPQLIESYVNSIIPKTNKPEHTNEPILEEEILALFHSDKKLKAGRKRKSRVEESEDADSQGKLLCPQLLILYYLLLYEDLYHTHKKLIDVTKLSLYSDTVMSQIPISYLVQEALKQRNNCQNLFPPMIRLLSIHFPHLCLVEDWLDAHVGLMTSDSASAQRKSGKTKVTVRADDVKQAFSRAQSHPAEAIRLLEELSSQANLASLQECQDAVLAGIPAMLRPGTPRRLVDLVKATWFRLHALTPRKLRLSTVNVLQPEGRPEPLTEQDLVVDPLVVLRCDERVFRCPPVLEIVLRILAAYMQACRVYLNSHMLDAAVTDKEKDRQELKIALLAAQDSAIVQILLEVCLPLGSEMGKEHTELCDLREVRCLVFSHIHQVFIADPNLAKLVHFQGYPSELIPLVVAGVPSMHICLDFIPELLGQPQRNKQVFGVQLLAQLCRQYHLPKSMNIAKLGIDIMFTLLSVLEKSEWVSFFRQTVPSLLPICEAFPPLCDESTSLLSQIGRVCYAHMTVVGNAAKTNSSRSLEVSKLGSPVSPSAEYEGLYSTVQQTFTQICEKAVVLGKVY
ncbi:integrator complex subunit 2 [Aplysia californica]|uniref:Integrator complex subunit 2 n=1 Tax=Aplysia californica TaxID=6500 RepID=A0ABM0K6P4_APLCA|nr:integrator complex subunit 2 [Aplysia californica]